MAGEFADEVRVFDLFVEVAYKGSTGKVGTGYICDTFLFVLAGYWVSDCHHSFYAGFHTRIQFAEHQRNCVPRIDFTRQPTEIITSRL